jgi:hypothetical protein
MGYAFWLFVSFAGGGTFGYCFGMWPENISGNHLCLIGVATLGAIGMWLREAEKELRGA